jgi:hypothetical protein
MAWLRLSVAAGAACAVAAPALGAGAAKAGAKAKQSRLSPMHKSSGHGNLKMQLCQFTLVAVLKNGCFSVSAPYFAHGVTYFTQGGVGFYSLKQKWECVFAGSHRIFELG